MLSTAQKLESEMKWLEAAKEYVRLLESPPTMYTLERVAWCFSCAGEYGQANTYLRKLNELQPASAKWLYMIGYQYYCQKDWKSAVEWFEKSLAQYKDYFIVKYRLAYALTQVAGGYMKLTKGEYWQAIGHLNDCHGLWGSFDEGKRRSNQSTYFDVCFLHGKALMNLPRNREEAVSLFRKALEIKPSDEYAKYELSKTLYLSELYQEAKGLLPKSNQYFVIELSAKIEGKLGNYDRAIEIIEKLLRKRKKDYLYAFLAKVYLLKDDLESAYECSQAAIKLGKKNHKNYFIAAKVYYKLGLLDISLENAKIAVSMKQAKYETEFVECEELIEAILNKKPLGYLDDQELIAKLTQESKPKKGNNKSTGSDIKVGTVCRYNFDKGYGFIKADSKDIFFHISNCSYKEVKIGDKVTFETSSSPKGPMALKVRQRD